MKGIHTPRPGPAIRCLVLAAAISLAGGTGWTETYDLDGVLEAVREHNEDLLIAEQEKKSGEARRREARSTALPSLGLEAGYTRNLTDYYMYIDKSALAPGASGTVKAPMRRDNEFSSTLALQQTLYSHEVGSAIQAAKEYTRLMDFTYEATEQSLLTNAKKLFYQCLFLEKVADVSRAAMENALANYDIMQLKYDQGQVSEFELLQAETRWRSTIPDVQQAERNLKLALNSLKNLAGIDMHREITLEGSFDNIPDMPGTVDERDVLADRPDFQALRWQKDLLRTSLEAARKARRPKVTGTLAYSYSAQSNDPALEEENNLVFVGINLSMPLYTGGYIDAQKQKAAIEVKKTDLELEKNKETISKDVVNARLRLEEARLRIDSAKATRATAKKASELAEVSARAGLATQLQLKDARLAYDRASIQYFAAVSDYYAAYFDWEYTTGGME